MLTSTATSRSAGVSMSHEQHCSGCCDKETRGVQELTAPRKPGEGLGETEGWGRLARAASSALRPRRWAPAASRGWSRRGGPREPPPLSPAGLRSPRLRQHLELDHFRHPSSWRRLRRGAGHCRVLRETRLHSDIHYGGEGAHFSTRLGTVTLSCTCKQESHPNQTGATNRVCLASPGVQGWLVCLAHQVARAVQAVQAVQAGWGSPRSRQCCWLLGCQRLLWS